MSQIDPSVVRAFTTGDAAALRRALAEQPELRKRIDEPLCAFDSTLLVNVAGRGDLAVVDVLLEFGADPNRRTDWWAGGFHPLHVAEGVVAQRLIEAGAVVDACAASHLDRIDVLRELLDEDPGRVHERGGDGQTPLHFARSREVVDLLLERGADPDATDVDHRAPAAAWMLAGRRGAGRYDLAGYLVDRGASADVFLAAALGLVARLEELLSLQPEVTAHRTGQGTYGERPPSSFHIYTWSLGQNLSPLQVAAQFEQEGALALLERHAGPNERFLVACADAEEGAARRLLEAHPELVARLTDAEQRALPDAAWAGRAGAVRLMLDLGFDPDARGQDGGTVLHCAAWQGSVACVEAVLEHPGGAALLERPDPTHASTPLGWCCHGAQHGRNPEGDYPAVARLLLAAGARPGPNLDDAPTDVRAVIDAARDRA